MRDILKKHWLCLLFLFLLLVFVIPLVINWAYRQPAFFHCFAVDWNVEDVLAFYGTLLAALATVLGVYLSILFAQKNYRKDERNRVVPYLALSHMREKSKFNLFSGIASGERSGHPSDEPDEYYKEYRLDRVYIILSNGVVAFKDKLSTEQQRILLQNGAVWEQTGKGFSLVAKEYISLAFDVDNVGNGAAIDLKLEFSKKGCTNPKAVSFFTLKEKDSIYFHVFSEVENDSVLGDYILKFQYYDILNNRYTQEYPFSFSRADGRIKQTVDFSNRQQMIEESNNELPF